MKIAFTIPKLETERLFLSPMMEAHLDGLCEIWGDEDTCRFIGGPKSRMETWSSLASTVGHWLWRGYGIWVVEEKESKAVVGWSGVWYPEGWPEPELIWTLNKRFRGEGYATEAATEARSWAYKEGGLDTLISLIAPENTPSVSVAKRLGSRYEKQWELRGKEVSVWRHPSPGSV